MDRKCEYFIISVKPSILTEQNDLGAGKEKPFFEAMKSWR
jgi:hypothetical protein